MIRVEEFELNEIWTQRCKLAGDGRRRRVIIGAVEDQSRDYQLLRACDPVEIPKRDGTRQAAPVW